MRAAVLSDSHGDTYDMMRLFESMDGVDLIFFLGDITNDVIWFKKEMQTRGVNIPIYSVKGNNDVMSREPESMTIGMEEQTIFLTHGHLYGVKQGTERLAHAARMAEAGIALFGHTHTRYASFEHGVFLLNPGAVCGCYPSLKKSAAILEVTGKKITYSFLDLE